MTAKLEITDAEIESAWGNANFGKQLSTFHKRDFIRCAVMKKAMDYHCGYTITQIMNTLGLLNKNELPSKKGRIFLRGLYERLEYDP